MITYSEKLKDPRWQKKRLRVLEAAGWKCEFCGASDKALHVHHLKYTGEPWDAPMEDLEALCQDHHDLVHSEGSLLTVSFDLRASKARELLSAITAYEQKSSAASVSTSKETVLSEAIRCAIAIGVERTKEILKSAMEAQL